MLEKVSVKQTEKKSTGTFGELAVTGCCGCCICRFKRRLDKFKDANASLRDVDPNKRMRKWRCWRKGLQKKLGPQTVCPVALAGPVWNGMDILDQRDISQLLNALTCFIQQQHGLKGDACGICA